MGPRRIIERGRRRYTSSACRRSPQRPGVEASFAGTDRRQGGV